MKLSIYLFQPDCLKMSTSKTHQEVSRQDGGLLARSRLKVMLLGSGWNSSEGGLSTFNREFAIHLSKHFKVELTLLVPKGACNDDEKSEARGYGINIVDAKDRHGFGELGCLISPPEGLNIDVIVGHGMKLGYQVPVLLENVKFNSCKWVQVVHTAPEDLSKYKKYLNSISKGEKKHEVEVDLCKDADLVVPVGPRLAEKYLKYLQRQKKDEDFFLFTPGLFEREFGDLEQAANSSTHFNVLIFGRGDKEDFELKGYDIAAKAFTDQRLRKEQYHLLFVGAPKGEQDMVTERLLKCGISEDQLTVRQFVESRDRIKDLLCEADLVIMPSRSEGFGLVSLEALSAGLPILVSYRSGIAKALEKVVVGHSCIVNSDDPAKWAEAIEDVRSRHDMRLQEINIMRKEYGKMYNWKEQIEALVKRMWKIVHGKSCTKVLIILLFFFCFFLSFFLFSKTNLKIGERA